MTSVYIETTVPSFYYTARTDPESVARMHWTRQWWNNYAATFTLVTSAVVIDELRRGSSDKTRERLALLDGMIILPVTDEIVEIAQIYIDKLVMPKAPGDALHLAIASYHKVDALLTWNCQHLANANKLNHIRRVNFEMGLSTPILTTPLNYLGDEVSDE